MNSNMTLAVEFKGSQAINGVPGNLEGSIRMIETKGGFISTSNTNGTAIFGVMMSVNPAGDPQALYVGLPNGYVFVGPLLNEQGIRENDPAKPNWIINGMPATVVLAGTLWYPSWAKTLAAAIDPVVGCLVVAKDADGTIEFQTAGASIPAASHKVNAAVVDVDTLGNGALLRFFSIVAANA